MDRFVPPGPPLSAVDSPQLFAALNRVSSSTQQAMPADVYLVNDVNAFVAQRGDAMGFGSRRVIGIGLPLMQALTAAGARGRPRPRVRALPCRLMAVALGKVTPEQWAARCVELGIESVTLQMAAFGAARSFAVDCRPLRGRQAPHTRAPRGRHLNVRHRAQ